MESPKKIVFLKWYASYGPIRILKQQNVFE